MLIIKKIKILYKTITLLKKTDKTIGLVPTMGNLHNGHVKLILLAKQYADIIIVSIFINPMQFNNLLDLKNYPQSFKEDCIILKQHNVDIVFFLISMKFIRMVQQSKHLLKCRHYLEL